MPTNRKNNENEKKRFPALKKKKWNKKAIYKC